MLKSYIPENLYNAINNIPYDSLCELRLRSENAVVVNTARGLVTDEKELCNALKEGRIAGFGTDVYSVEPFGKESPFFEIKDYPNTCFTPHMAWGTVEARERCFDEMLKNTQAFLKGERRNRIV